jgi:hypothetical protein
MSRPGRSGSCRPANAAWASAVVKYAQPEPGSESGGGGPGLVATAAAPPGARRVR